MLWKLYYDGGCNLCHRSKLRAERWAERSGQPLEAIPIQSEEGVAKGYDLHEMILVAEREFRGADAWLMLCGLGPRHVRWLSPLRRFAPSRWLAHLGYRLVARIRYRVFGRRVCEIPVSAKGQK